MSGHPSSFAVEDAAAVPKRRSVFPTGVSFQSGFATFHARSRVHLGEHLTEIEDEAKPKTTLMQTSSTFVNFLIGAGILGFPGTFAKGGWYCASAILMLCAYSVGHVGYLLEESTATVEERIARGEQFSFGKVVGRYEDLAEAAMGPRGKVVVGFAVNGYLLLLCAAYIILIGESLNVLAGWNKEMCTIATGAVFMPLSLVDDMTIIAKLSVVGVLASVVYVVTIGWAGIEASMWDRSILDAPVEYTWMLPLEDITQLGSVVAVMLLGFGFPIAANTVRADMQEKHQMPEAAKNAVFICGTVYGVAGVLAYMGFGNAVNGNVTLSMVYPANMPVVGGQTMLTGTMLSAAVVASLLVGFPVLLNCVSRAAEVALFGKYSRFVRLVLVTAALVIGYLLPYFFEFLALIGALVGAPVIIFIPILMYWLIAKQDGKSIDATMVAKHIVILLLGLVAFGFGTYDAILGFLKAFENSL